MNFPQRLLRLCTFGCGMLLLFSLRPALGGAIPTDIKNGSDADKPPQRAQVAAAVTAQLEPLGGTEPDKRGKARDALINELTPIGKQSFNPTFCDVYAQEINTQLMPLATNPDVRVRLNIAIIVARVAEKAENSRLLKITETLMDDKSDAVRIWAVRAAGSVLPPLLQAGVPQQQKALLAKIKEAAKNSLLVTLSYEALTLNYLNLKTLPPTWNKCVQLVFPEIMEILQGRIEALRLGAVPEPAADSLPISFLVDGRIWKECTAPQQLQIVQTILNLMSFGGHRLAQPGVPDRDQLIIIVRRAGRALGAAALKVGDANLSKSLEPFSNIDPNAANFLATIDAVFPKLQQVPAWKGLKAPPKIETSPGTQPTTAPASSPATAPAK